MECRPGKECAMRKWYVPLTIAGIGGLGVFLLSESGKGVRDWIRQNLHWNSQGMLEWNESAEAELQTIRARLRALADSLQPRVPIGG